MMGAHIVVTTHWNNRSLDEYPKFVVMLYEVLLAILRGCAVSAASLIQSLLSHRLLSHRSNFHVNPALYRKLCLS